MNFAPVMVTLYEDLEVFILEGSKYEDEDMIDQLEKGRFEVTIVPLLEIGIMGGFLEVSSGTKIITTNQKSKVITEEIGD